MSSVQELDDTIAEQQRGMEAVQAQIQQARDKDQLDLAVSLEKQVTDYANQISSLQSDRTKAVEREKQQAADEARADQKDKDKGIGINDFF